MADKTYSLADMVDKTIVANSPTPIYAHADDGNTHANDPIGTIDTGQPIGQLYSWLLPDVTVDRSELFLMFWPDNKDPFYTKWDAKYYNFNALEAQGLQTDAQKKAAEDLAKLPWYEQLLVKYGPWVLGTILVGAVIKGLLSRPKVYNGNR